MNEKIHPHKQLQGRIIFFVSKPAIDHYSDVMVPETNIGLCLLVDNKVLNKNSIGNAVLEQQ